MRHVTRTSRHIGSPIQQAVAEVLEPRRLLAGIESGILVARGTANADTISVRRSGGDDVIITTNGVNQTFDMDDFTGVRIEGLGGDDTFRLIDPLTSPVVRQVTVSGGAGNDTVDYSARTTALTFTGYQDPDSATLVPFAVVSTGAQADRVDFTVERFIGGSGNDTFTMGGGVIEREDEPALVLEGRGGNDLFRHVPDLNVTMFGGAANDFFEVDAEAAQFRAIYGGDGDDTISLDNEGLPEFVDTGAGIDTLRLFGSHLDVIDASGFAGLDNFEGIGAQGGSVTIIGTELGNRMTVDDENEGGVTLIGNGGNDTLTGGPGDDLLQGGPGNDSLVGAFGDDTLDGGTGTDTVDGGPGNNTILDGEIRPAAPNIRISNRTLIADGSWGQDLITIERSGGDDVIVRVNEVSRTFDMDDFDGILLRGNGGWDDLRVLQPIVAGSLTPGVTLLGGGGNDTLTGSQGGNERLDGGDGDDFLDARDFAGVDTVIGGSGVDNATVDPADQTSGIEFFQS